jgi:hypothetical protein
MQHDKWTLEKALAEANRYGISIFERGMKKFVADFSKLISQAQEIVKNQEAGKSVAAIPNQISVP